MASSVIMNPTETVKGAIRLITKSKEASTANYLASGLNALNSVCIAAYESENAVGAVISIGRVNNSIMAYAFSSDGSPYTGALTVTFYYIPIT